MYTALLCTIQRKARDAVAAMATTAESDSACVSFYSSLNNTRGNGNAAGQI